MAADIQLAVEEVAYRHGSNASSEVVCRMRCKCSTLIGHGTVISGDRGKGAKAAVKLRSLRKEEERGVEDLKGEAMGSLGG